MKHEKTPPRRPRPRRMQVPCPHSATRRPEDIPADAKAGEPDAVLQDQKWMAIWGRSTRGLIDCKGDPEGSLAEDEYP